MFIVARGGNVVSRERRSRAEADKNDKEKRCSVGVTGFLGIFPAAFPVGYPRGWCLMGTGEEVEAKQSVLSLLPFFLLSKLLQIDIKK